MVKLKTTIDELNIDNIDLQNIEELSLLDENTNTYILQLQACVYSLLDGHDSCETVNMTIDSVLKLCNKKAAKLPSVSTVNTCNWSMERTLLRENIFLKPVNLRIPHCIQMRP